MELPFVACFLFPPKVSSATDRASKRTLSSFTWDIMSQSLARNRDISSQQNQDSSPITIVSETCMLRSSEETSLSLIRPERTKRRYQRFVIILR